MPPLVDGGVAETTTTLSQKYTTSNQVWKCRCVHGHYNCTFGLGAGGGRLERANGQNLVCAMVCCVSNETEIAAQQEKQKLRDRCHGVLFHASHSQAEMQ
jgi:hypothetical protein